VLAEYRGVALSIELPAAQTAEAAFVGGHGTYRVINVDRNRWLIYGDAPLDYAAMLVGRDATFELRPMHPPGPDLAACDLEELVGAL
jgi:hypothetical protein